jgi:hypothetical protein
MCEVRGGRRYRDGAGWDAIQAVCCDENVGVRLFFDRRSAVCRDCIPAYGTTAVMLIQDAAVHLIQQFWWPFWYGFGQAFFHD